MCIEYLKVAKGVQLKSSHHKKKKLQLYPLENSSDFNTEFTYQIYVRSISKELLSLSDKADIAKNQLSP